MSDCYVIMDLDGYVKEMRTAVANSIADQTDENLDNYISLDQMKTLVDSWCIGFDDNERPILDEESNINIFEDTKIWMTNVGLARLAAQGFIECAWDSNLNEMVFWYPDKEKQQDAPKRNKSTKNKRSKRKDQ